MDWETELGDLLEDADVAGQIKGLYLDTICEDIPDKHRLSSSFNFRVYVIGHAYDWNEKYGENEREKAFEEWFSKTEKLIPEISKIPKQDIYEASEVIKFDYMKRFLKEAKTNRDLIFKVMGEFPNRLEKGRDMIVKEYKLSDEIPCKELFYDLVLDDYKRLKHDMGWLLYDYGSRKVLQILEEDEIFIKFWEEQRENRKGFKKAMRGK